MVKICQTRLLKSYQKNAFSGFCQKFPQAMDEVKKFFLPISKSLGPQGVRDGWLLVIPQNVKKVKITAPYCACTWGSSHTPVWYFYRQPANLKIHVQYLTAPLFVRTLPRMPPPQHTPVLIHTRGGGEGTQCRGSCFLSYTSENSHHRTAKIISKEALC